MPGPTEPVKRVCYTDDITVWASGVHLTVLEDRINDYLEEITAFLKENSLLPKVNSDTFHSGHEEPKNHLRIIIENTALPLVQSPKTLGGHLDTTLAFHKHCNYVAGRILKLNNVRKAIS